MIYINPRKLKTKIGVTLFFLIVIVLLSTPKKETIVDVPLEFSSYEE